MELCNIAELESSVQSRESVEKLVLEKREREREREREIEITGESRIVARRELYKDIDYLNK